MSPPTNTNTAGQADGSLGYGWLGSEQRATDRSGLLLMGARLYNPVTGSFTSVDPVTGGNETAYGYPLDPVNGVDLDGQLFGFIKKGATRFAKKWKSNASGCADHKLKSCGKLFVNNVEALTAVTGVSGVARRVGKYAVKKGGKRVASKTAQSCRNSFLSGTQVLLADGSTKAIEAVQVGDLVLATNPETGESAAEEVIDLIPGSGLKDLVRVGTDPDADGATNWLMATEAHPFWVSARGWVDAGDLMLGDLLVSDDGRLVEVTSLSETVRVAVVHNLTIDRIHTYYVLAGEQPVLVHNASCPVHGHPPQGTGKTGKPKHQTADARRQKEQQKSTNKNKRRPQCTRQPHCPS